MAIRQITKQLAGEEDLTIGEGTEVQPRSSGNVTITKLNLAKWVVDAAALTALGTAKFIRAKVGDNEVPYYWESGDTQTPDGTTVIAGAGGNWLLADPSLALAIDLASIAPNFGASMIGVEDAGQRERCVADALSRDSGWVDE